MLIRGSNADQWFVVTGHNIDNRDSPSSWILNAESLPFKGACPIFTTSKNDKIRGSIPQNTYNYKTT